MKPHGIILKQTRVTDDVTPPSGDTVSSHAITLTSVLESTRKNRFGNLLGVIGRGDGRGGGGTLHADIVHLVSVLLIY